MCYELNLSKRYSKPQTDEVFRIKRRLRQGDPLSLFLFRLVAEAFQIINVKACKKNIYKGISLTDGGDNLSLLQYADDVLFFGKWSRSNANTLIHILNCIKEASGLKVNLAKSRIFRVGVDIDEVETVASSLGCIHDSIPFLYPGLPGMVLETWCGLWSWRIPPYDWAIDDLASLISPICNMALSSDDVDKWVWDRDASGTFKVKILSDNLQGILLSNHSLDSHHVWNSETLRKINICVWRASIDRLPTMYN
nr:RNA-directed DNA polymerase, eukaryota, reverse transcriptase zinc-binding domain protein [Tanacetum cinerariifolium]